MTSDLPASLETPATSNRSDRSAHEDPIVKSSKRLRQSSEVDGVSVSVMDVYVATNPQQSKDTPPQVLINEVSVVCFLDVL